MAYWSSPEQAHEYRFPPFAGSSLHSTGAPVSADPLAYRSPRGLLLSSPASDVRRASLASDVSSISDSSIGLAVPFPVYAPSSVPLRREAMQFPHGQPVPSYGVSPLLAFDSLDTGGLDQPLFTISDEPDMYSDVPYHHTLGLLEFTFPEEDLSAAPIDTLRQTFRLMPDALAPVPDCLESPTLSFSSSSDDCDTEFEDLCVPPPSTSEGEESHRSGKTPTFGDAISLELEYPGSDYCSPSRPEKRRRTESDADTKDEKPARPKVQGNKKPKMHQCPVCKKWFPRPSGLATHMNVHSGAKPFHCPMPSCPKSFAVRSNAKRHLRTHGIIPPPDFAFALPARRRWCPNSLGGLRLESANADGTVDDTGEWGRAGEGQAERVKMAGGMGRRDTWAMPYHPSDWRGLPGPAVWCVGA